MLDSVVLEPIKKQKKDQRRLAAILSREEARFIVGSYYRLQDNRIRAGHQAMRLGEANRPNETIAWLQEQNALLEEEMKKSLDVYSMNHPVGRWVRSIMGCGPVLASGLLAHIDPAKVPTAGHLMSFAGLVHGIKWEAGKLRPWNAELKKLTWLLSEAFVKVSNKEADVYGKIYKMRKEIEHLYNTAGMYAEAAARQLQEKNIRVKEVRATYESGRLPDGHIHARAKRYAAKMFLEHFFVIMQWNHSQAAIAPYVLPHLGHVHLLLPPHTEQFPGLDEALIPLYGPAATRDVSLWCDKHLRAARQKVAQASSKAYDVVT